MNSISSYNPSLCASPGLQEAYQSYSELQATPLSVSESQTQYLTHEGLTRKSILGEYQGNVTTRESLDMFQRKSFELEKSRSISISVDGDLNQQELKDIKKAIKGTLRIMTNLLYGGDMVKATAKAIEINESDTISGLGANSRYEKAVLVE
jgi:hypothetical protein